MADNPLRPFTPDPDFLARLPEGFSGNAINGLGEATPRRPRMVWWAPDPDSVAFGEAQKWFYAASPPDEEMLALRAERLVTLEAPLHDIAADPADRTPEDWTGALNAFVESGECERVGVARMQPDWVFEHEEVRFGTVIMLGVMHDYERLRQAPEPVSGKEVVRQYGRAAAVAKQVANWIRDLGWDAEPVMGPMTGRIAMIPPALECGFGELGKHGSIIDPVMGSNFRLSAVLTDAPFATTPRQVHGIDGFCTNCRICEDACPPFAISSEKQMVRGVEKWYVDFDACIPFFAETLGCGICIAVCPWSRPGVGVNLAAKLARRAERIGE